MFSRVLVTYAFDAAPKDTLALARCLAPAARSLYVVLRVPVEMQFAFGQAHLGRVERDLEAADRALEALRVTLGSQGIDVVGESVADVSPESLSDVLGRLAPDVIVFGGFPSSSPDVVAGWALETTRRFRIPSVAGRARGDGLARVVCPFDGRAASIASIAPFLRDRCDEHVTVTLFAMGPRDARFDVDMTAMREVTGLRAHVETQSITDAFRDGVRDVQAALLALHPDLIVVPSDFGSGFAADAVRSIVLWALPSDAPPVVFVPSSTTPNTAHEGSLDALDVLDLGRSVARLERIVALGGPRPFSGGAIDVVSGGSRVATLEAHDGMLALPSGLVGTLGLGRSARERDPIENIEAVINVLREVDGPIALVDAHLDAASMKRTHEAFDGESRTFIAVRLAPGEPARAIRMRMREAGFTRPCVVDVRDILDEGDTADVPSEVFAVRLCRAAARMRAHGLDIDVVVAFAPAYARGSGFAVLGVNDLGDLEAKRRATHRPPPDVRRATDLDVLTDSRTMPGNRLAIDLDNADARARLISTIDTAHTRLHAQWYIVEDDEVSREVEAALVRASARGVTVRIIVDALYSRHQSFGARNALLERLASTPLVEVRASRPIASLPALEDLKRRDHRKLVIADGTRGIVSGRNLARTYYRSFEEARVSRSSGWAEVPWLDASAWLEGPAVEDLERSFLDAWIETGAETFTINPAPAVGDTDVRVVVHRGLEDAYTLEAYLSIIEDARTRLIVVNSFPLQREVLHALLRAVDRGVRVSVLVGHVRPVYGDDIAFGGGAYRALVDALVRARLAALVDVGADVREFIVQNVAGWDASLGTVRPYVHAKLLCADASRIAIGSANLDVTAGYWESEALVVVTDADVGRDLDTRLEQWLASALPIDPRDPKWQSGADVRAWLGRVWPSVLS